MGTYDRQVATARRMIEAKGGRVTWRKPGIAVADPNEPWKEVAVADVDYPSTPIVFVPENIDLANFMQAIRGTEIKTGRLKGIMPGDVPFSPDPADVAIDVDGEVFQIDSVDKLDPTGTQVIVWYIIFKG